MPRGPGGEKRPADVVGAAIMVARLSVWAFDSLRGFRLIAPVHPVDAKIESFANLREGWRYGEGGPISQETINAALEWRRFLTLHGASKIAAVPGPNREVVIAATINDKYTEIIAEPDATFTIVRDHQDDQDDIYRSDLSMSDAEGIVLEMMGTEWTMFDGFIRMNFSQNMAGFPAPPSRILEERTSPAVYHLLTANVSLPLARPYAIMQESSIGKQTPLASHACGDPTSVVIGSHANAGACPQPPDAKQ